MLPPDVEHRIPSPDARYELVIHDCRETSMGRYDARVMLLDANSNLVEDFAPLFAETSGSGAWSEDSGHLAFAARMAGHSFYVVWQPATACFATVRIVNPYPLEFGFVGARALKVQVRSSQLDAANSEHVFGGERAEFPIARFKMAEALVVELASLSFRDRSELAGIPGVIESQPLHHVALEPDGFFPYDGPPLQSTSQVVNGRKILFVHLEAFAAWGDEVAQAWLAEARRRLGDRYDRWQTVAGVLGKRSR